MAVVAERMERSRSFDEEEYGFEMLSLKTEREFSSWACANWPSTKRRLRCGLEFPEPLEVFAVGFTIDLTVEM